MSEENTYKQKYKDKIRRIKDKSSKLRFKSTSLWDELVIKITHTVKYYVLFEIIVMIALMAILYVWNPLSISTNYPAQTIILVLMVSFVMIMSAFYVGWRGKNVINNAPKYPILTFIARTSIFILILAALVYWAYVVATGLFWVTPHFPKFISLFGHLSFVAALIIGLAAIYIAFKPIITDATAGNRYLKFIEHVIFYVPCLLINLINYLKEQQKITTKTVWIVLGIEIIFIILYLLVPYLYKLISISDGSQLLKEPVYIDYVTELGPFQGLTKKDVFDGKNFNYNYAVSAWFRLNPQPINTRLAYSKFTNILTFGNKPRLEFNGLYNKLRIRTDLGNGEQMLIYSTQNISYQKWNYIVINYEGGTMDIFINGDLVASRPDVAPCMSTDLVVAGENEGLEGGICNVIYFDRPRTKREIIGTYKSLRSSEPPVF